jgi:16S rRNA (uracil1498-N3)-methyltransferase
MNLIILFQNDFIQKNYARINDRRSDHILNIHRANIGDQLSVGILNGMIGTAIVRKINGAEIELELELESELETDVDVTSKENTTNPYTKQPPAPLPLTLIIALPRPKMIKRILQTCATMGVKDIIFLNSYRVEKSYWQTPLLQEDKIQEQLLLGLEQGKDTILPKVTLEKRFKPFVEDTLPALCKTSMGLLAHPHSEQPCPTHVTQHTTLIIGPEGGFIPYEVEKIQMAGCQGITLGQRILRVETAIPALLGKLF